MKQDIASEFKQSLAKGKKVFESLIKQEEGHIKIIQAALDTIGKHKRYPLLPRFIGL